MWFLALRTEPEGIVIPTRAVRAASRVNYVFVVRSTPLVESRRGNCPSVVGNQESVVEGLKPWREPVVTADNSSSFRVARVEDQDSMQSATDSRKNRMNLSKSSSDVPSYHLVMTGILLFGIFATVSLPVSDLPNVDFPTLVVSAQPARGESRNMAFPL